MPGTSPGMTEKSGTLFPVIARSEAEAIHFSPRRAMDCFASLAMTWRELPVTAHGNYSPRYALRTSGLTRMSAALPCISTRPVCRM